MKMGGWSNIETVLKYYIKTSDENEKKAVRILDELMSREKENRVEVGERGVGSSFFDNFSTSAHFFCNTTVFCASIIGTGSRTDRL